VFRGKRKFIVMAAAGTAAVVAAGTAYAMWSAGGSGNGTSKALSAQAITVTAATGSADLYPGFSGGDLSFTLSNSNPYPVNLTTMTTTAITSSSPVACPASNLTVTTPATVSIPLAAAATNVATTVADVATLASAAPDGCQGVTFTVALTLSGIQTP